MAEVYRWEELNRTELARCAPATVVAVPIGSTEQHGPHLATGADALLARHIAERGARLARFDGSVLLTPTLHFGMSEHHLPFGATLSLSPTTLVAVLIDLLRSIARAGFTRVIVINGHGGNTASLHSASSTAAREFELLVVHTSYWELVGVAPGHAGEWETSLMMALSGDLVDTSLACPSPLQGSQEIPGAKVEDPHWWSAMDGFSDDPRSATEELGTARLKEICQRFAEVLEHTASYDSRSAR